MHTIENEQLRVSAQAKGAELISIFHQPTGTEHLWQADKTYWGWHAPVLFPVVGRCLNDEVIVSGKNYPMPKHGFARHAPFELTAKHPHCMRFAIRENEDTLRSYPFRFAFEIEYSLRENTLNTSYRITNHSDNNMPFCIGGHPAFAVPFNADEQFSDYFLMFEKEETEHRHHINGDGFFDGRRSPVFESKNLIPLHESLFEDDALIFKKLNSSAVSIRSHKHERKLTVTFPDFNYLGVWTKPGAPYVCIEPWLGCADTDGNPVEFDSKEGVILLPPNQGFEALFSVSVF